MDVLIDIRQDVIHLLMLGRRFFRLIGGKFFFSMVFVGLQIKNTVQKYHQLCESGFFHQITAKSIGAGDLMDIVEKPLLLFHVQGQLVADLFPAGKTIVQIRGRRGNGFQKGRGNGEDDAFMDLFVDLA